MTLPSIYINLKDDVSKVIERIKRERSSELVLVCPKRCQLFSDSINLRLLKKQVDLLGKEVFILTMDEKGQLYAQEAGFKLKFLPKGQHAKGISDIKLSKSNTAGQAQPHQSPQQHKAGPISGTFDTIKHAANRLVSPKAEEPRPHSHVQEPLNSAAAKTPGRSATKITTPKVAVQDSFYPRELETANQKNKQKNYHQKVITGLVALSLIVIAAVVFIVLPKATVAVYPKTEPVTRDMEISASTQATAPDADRLVLPATQVAETLEVNNKFQAEGKKEVGNKATGTIQIYNFTRQPLNLRAGTTILTVGSKNYLLAADVAGIKPTGYSDPKTKEVDTNTLGAPIQIIAEQGGESYNLPAGVRMEITNQVFGSKPQFLFAKTYSAITGGTSRFLSVVSQQDIDSSRNALGDQLVGQLNDELKAKNLTLINKAYTLESIQFTTDKPAGTESPYFQADLKAKVTGLAINPDDLTKLVTDRITQTLASNKTLESKDGNPPSYTLKSIDPAFQQAILSVHYEGQAVMNVDLQGIAQDLVGKSRSQATEILRSRAEVDRIDITIAPSWQQNFPFFAQKINVIVENNSPDTSSQ